jgi:hypothetical protein
MDDKKLPRVRSHKPRVQQLNLSVSMTSPRPVVHWHHLLSSLFRFLAWISLNAEIQLTHQSRRNAF